MRLNLTLSALILGSLSLSVAAGCSSAPAEDPVGGSADEIQTATPIKPVDVVRCWIAPDTQAASEFFQAHDFRCARAEGGDYPLLPKEITVEVHTARQNAFYKDVGDAELSIGKLRNEDFPVKVYTKLRYDTTTTVGSMFGLKEERQVATLAAASATKPLVYTSPFTIWGVNIKSTDARMGGRLYAASSYKVPTGSFKAGYNFGIPDNDPAELSVRTNAQATDGRLELALIAPPSGPITLNINGAPVTITKPGAFVWNGESLSADGASPPPDPGPEVVVPPAAPTCGGDGAAVCPTGECAPLHRVIGSVCRPCGTNGLTYCGTYDARVCAAEHRVAGDVCVSCGQDNQTYCGSYDRRSCAPGHRVAGDTCRVCGDDNQTYCGTYENRTCAPGHRVAGDICRVCGGEGQTYCGTYDARSCNDGLRVVGDVCKR